MREKGEEEEENCHEKCCIVISASGQKLHALSLSLSLQERKEGGKRGRGGGGEPEIIAAEKHI